MSASRMKVGTQKRSARPVPLSCNQHPVLSGPVRGAVEDQLEQLKRHLLQPILAKLGDTPLVQEVLWAANEAAALAWCTVCPVLVLPALLDEKVADALSKWRKQQKLRGEPGSRVPRPEPRYLCEAA